MAFEEAESAQEQAEAWAQQLATSGTALLSAARPAQDAPLWLEALAGCVDRTREHMGAADRGPLPSHAVEEKDGCQGGS